jgi:short-subunit dehydrogenase
MASETASRPVALVTGASSGIGAAFAERLARDGYDLIVVARRRERLEALAERLRAEHGASVDTLAADLSRSGELAAVEQRIADEGALALLVNNAGFGAYMPFLDLDPDRAEELIRVQVIAVTRLTRSAVTGMVARGRGAIINVSSRLAFSGPLKSPPLPKRATYAATKAFINTFTQILADELAGTGVQVQALCPGLVTTEFHQTVQIDAARLQVPMMQPADLVEASLAGLRLGEVICVPGLDDPALLEGLAAAQRELLAKSGSAVPAGRYGGSA